MRPAERIRRLLCLDHLGGKKPENFVYIYTDEWLH